MFFVVVVLSVFFFLKIKNLDHNLDYIVLSCTYTIPLHFDGLDVDDVNRMDGNVDGNCPYMDQFGRHTDTMIFAAVAVVANNVASLFFDQNNNQHSLDTFVVYANCQNVHHDRCLNWQNAATKR